MVVLVIEHLEPVMTPWTYLEYKHAASMVANLVVTNVRNAKERRCLEPYVDVVEESVGELASGDEILVLDPKAEKPLQPQDFQNFRYIVIGGIMGEFPPKGRTKVLLTDRLKAAARTLGPCQLSVDGAAYVAAKLEQGITDIVVAQGVVLRSGHVEVHLPYCYPVDSGKVVFSPELASYIFSLLEDDEAYAAREGVPRSIADYGCHLELPHVEYVVSAGIFAKLTDLMHGAL